MFKRILLPLALQEPVPNETALEIVLDLIGERKDAELILLNVIPDYGMPIVASYFPPEARQNALQDAERRLAEFVGKHIPKSIKTRQVVKEGRPSEQIVGVAQELEADLIVMRSFQLNTVSGYLLGSTTERVVRHAHCSVTVVRD